MRDALRAVGIRHAGPLRAGRTPTGATTVASVKSPPLRVILRHMNPDSDNFIAETLTKDVGAYAAGVGSTAAGTAYVNRLLRERGIFTGGERLVDGSGLSRADRLTATGLVRLVLAADADPGWGDALLRSLPRGGEGTLVRRLRGSAVRARVRAKTGYINGVSALSGRVVSRRGERYAFSFLMSTSQTTAARAAQDRMVTLLAAGRADRR
jgi:D-alanyl-D-alanine carboxypeptidase/D-alanyl-D-alanine-endopeptidase (penicillin-binding protein 4)